jgi:hypothetical protein
MRTTTPKNAAENLNMPALSPTMTEGTISSWKVKEGSFHLSTILRRKQIEEMIGKWELRE